MESFYAIRLCQNPFLSQNVLIEYFSRLICLLSLRRMTCAGFYEILEKIIKLPYSMFFFRFEHPFSCKISLQWPNLIKWICEEWDTLSAANFYMVVLWVITPLNTMTWWSIYGPVCNVVKEIICLIKSNLLLQKNKSIY